ncbi:hypothetical protein Tco_1045583 [Tanacetum coccineum]|uniref:Maturase K n=1 Tax=Tanacetum coccineum TaxID=301880 RepID=A0ABQ5GTK0_9ASTR
MQELSRQLQELQDKGFIRPSHSPVREAQSLPYVLSTNQCPSSLYGSDESSLQTVSRYSSSEVFIDEFLIYLPRNRKEEHVVHLRFSLEIIEKEEVCMLNSPSVSFWLQDSAFPWSRGHPEWYPPGTK